MKQTLVALVEDKPGILNRISSMFRRRNFNIESLVVGSSETPGISRMTIIANEPDSTKRGNIYFNLLNLVNVISVEDITSLPCINREYVLIKIHAGSGKWSSIGEVTKNNGARIVDMGKGSVIIEAAGEEKSITELIENLSQFKIEEIMRTGKIAMRIGESQDSDNIVSESQEDAAHWADKKINSYFNT